MADRAAQRGAAEVIPRKKARAYVHVALRHTLRDLGWSRAEFAARCGVNESTVTRWMSRRTAVLLEAVLCSRHVARRFLVCLLAELKGAR